MNNEQTLAEKVLLYLGDSVEHAVMTFAEDGSTWQELIDLAKKVQDSRQGILPVATPQFQGLEAGGREIVRVSGGEVSIADDATRGDLCYAILYLIRAINEGPPQAPRPAMIGTDSASLNENTEPEHGRWWGPEFCMIPADQQPIMDGCYFCGRPVNGLNGEHNHTMSEKEGFRGATRTRYSCVCENC